MCFTLFPLFCTYYTLQISTPRIPASLHCKVLYRLFTSNVPSLAGVSLSLIFFSPASCVAVAPLDPTLLCHHTNLCLAVSSSSDRYSRAGPAGRLTTLRHAVVTAPGSASRTPGSWPRPGSALITDRLTPPRHVAVTAPGLSPFLAPRPSARLGPFHPRLRVTIWRAGYAGARATRLRLVSVGPAATHHVPPWRLIPHHGFPHLRHVPPSRIAVRLCAFRKADWLIRCQMRWGQRKGKLRVFPRRAGSARIPAPSSWEGRSTAVRARSPHGAATRD